MMVRSGKTTMCCRGSLIISGSTGQKKKKNKKKLGDANDNVKIKLRSAAQAEPREWSGE